MYDFSRLLDQVYYTYSTHAKLKLLKQYFLATPDPERGFAIAIIAGTLNFKFFKRSLIQEIIREHIDPELFHLSYDYVGDLAETVALLWPAEIQHEKMLPSLAKLVNDFSGLNKQELKNYLIELLNICTPIQRWALLKMGTGSLRIGVSARLIKQALADFSNKNILAIEEIWHAMQPPYENLFSWLENKTDKPDINQQIYFRPVMLAHPLTDNDLFKINPLDFSVEWKYDGIRIQFVSGSSGCTIYTRTGDDISLSFPDILYDIDFHAVLDGELVIKKSGDFASFNDLQQRLNRKKPTKKIMQDLPAHVILYDILSINQLDLRIRSFSERRKILEQWFKETAPKNFSISPCLHFTTVDSLYQLKEQIKSNPAPAIEGLMLKRNESTYLAGRIKGQWYKWKRDPYFVDAILMYAQRGHGNRSSYYSDYTFGLWTKQQNLLTIGKAYFGFTDEELKQIDNWVRQNTLHKFGPVREVKKNLVLEIAFDAVQKSSRYKSGYTLRFPRIARVRWDKPAAEADTLEYLENFLLK